MTTSAPSRVESRVESGPPCQAMLQCADKCCDPVQCERLAVARVTFHCDTPECDHATLVMLLCAACADEATDCVPAPTRRPL
jgi:hypothetical protein